MSPLIRRRSFLFLQGPHGPFFAMLGTALKQAGYEVERINLNGGDQADWPGEAVNYRGTERDWPLFFDDFVVDHGTTDLILFGDCRPLHSAAHKMAKLRAIRIHVIEEGYLRPDFVTLEEDGVNGHSTLPRDPAWYLDAARTLPDDAGDVEVPSIFKRRLRETTRYALADALRRARFPFYSTHRPYAFWVEAVGWARRLAGRGREARESAKVFERVRGTPYFALPLQLNSDYQIRVHSPFGDMRAALGFAIKSFARSAPPEVNLLVKRHPLDAGLVGWRRVVRQLARDHGVADRIFYMPAGDIGPVVAEALGVVTVNSTVGTLALNRGVPVAVLGDAVYDIPGIIHRDPLDLFWRYPKAPDAELYDAFRRVLIDRCLIRGGFLSDEGLAMLVANAFQRLTADGKGTIAPEELAPICR